MTDFRVKCLIVDIGDVICRWSLPDSSSIPGPIFRRILRSHTWYEYRLGQIEQEQCYSRIAVEYSINPADLGMVLEKAGEALTMDKEMERLLLHLKGQQPHLRVFAMSNMSAPDWQIVKSKDFAWEIFDHIFLSSDVGMCKPEIRFFKHVLNEISASPQDAVFVDDSVDNCSIAQILGMRSIHFTDSVNGRNQILNHLINPAKRGRDYLKDNARMLKSSTDSQHEFGDTFSELLILETTKNPSFVDINPQPRTWNYFSPGECFLKDQLFPDDFETTAIASVIMPRMDSAIASSIMNEMLEKRNPDGILTTFCDPKRPKFDPPCVVNCLRMFFAYGRSDDPDIQSSKDYVRATLVNRAWEPHGFHYYPPEEPFLFYLTKLIKENDSHPWCIELTPLMQNCLREQINREGDAFILSTRILSCHYFGIYDGPDLVKLKRMQCADGSWMGWYCHTGMAKIKIGNRGLTTALAINAIESLEGANKASKVNGLSTYNTMLGMTNGSMTRD